MREITPEECEIVFGGDGTYGPVQQEPPLPPVPTGPVYPPGPTTIVPVGPQIPIGPGTTIGGSTITGPGGPAPGGVITIHF